MKAIIVQKYGTSDVIHVAEREIPTTGDSDLLIRTMASSISPVDIAFREGKPFISRLFTGLRKPRFEIPGDIVAGTVEKRGAEVAQFDVGDRVFGHTGTTFGAHGQYIAMHMNAAIVKMPKEMSYATAAALGYGGMTAMPFLEEHYEITSDTRVLINGASGAVGTFAIQFAKRKGAHVTAVCSGASAELVTSLGADEVIDYAREDFTSGERLFDFVFDAVGKSTFGTSKKVLRRGGIYLSTVPSLGLILRSALGLKSQGKSGKFVATGLRNTAQKKEDLRKLSDMFVAKELIAAIDREYTMDEVVEAHNHVEHDHKRGNTVLRMV